METVAGIFGFSPTYLSRIFKKYANVNYKTYVLNVRVEYAYKELVNTGQSINKIAESCGFDSIHYFSYTFKKNMGMTPSDYRRSMKQ